MERRVHPRVELAGTALYRKDIYPKLTLASILDLSLGGTKIETLYSLTKDDGLEITIGIQSRAIRCRGKVIHVSLPENGKVKAGIEFEGLPDHHRLYLRQYISYAMEQRS